MQLSSLIIQGLLLSGIIASPIAITDAVPEDFEGPSYPHNYTDVVAAGKKKTDKFCYDENKGHHCYKHSLKACVEWYKGEKNHFSEYDANNLCSFYCSKIKNADDCKTNKKKFNYAPPWGCDEQKYC
ncbi:putative secreted protein [Wickerhamomyces ciferrii]|uniref:Secreted protein n=1 Tax=Wickerhamomyces ciferrii (strain ATCC 14091 / BCRC 22168 / CBS 111 / JCM 3599 / NBRC 0793 / NRRL Y-1031 F-60-10) TaxID=1206466 RepID=K0KZI0_WICCF|nr:uncharacterized protein BN7_6136 [Wickerhamomyces ciferrii]CCH46543.1 putative secreted protein [Wickerhamomyces ciferrii]